ncbi:MAG: hypothetical protein ACJ76B_05700 [Solirubrobacterales bacterium]
MSDSSENGSGVEVLLMEQLRWLRAAALPSVRETVSTALKTSQQRKAYELCDGSKTGRDVAAAVGASPAAVTGWTQRWRNLGIAYETADKKIGHLVSLATLELPLEPPVED